jgi:hypothetical protein
VNGTVNATFQAAEFRSDLQNAGKGNGQHGFNFAPPANLKNGQPQAITMRVQGSSFLLTGSPKTITCAGTGTGPTTPTTPTNPNTNPTGSYEGSHDGANCGNIWGWIYSPGSPNTPITIEILANGNVVGSYLASEYRADVQAAGKGNGQHGFNFSPPSSIKNGQNQAISVRVSGNNFVLPGSPKTINCSGARLSASEIGSSETSDLKLTVYPNPTDGRFTVRFFASKGQKTQLRVVDLAGRKLNERQITGEGSLHEETISLSGETSGVYLIQIQQGAKMVTEKLILRK